MRLLAAEGMRRMPWKNGGGVTTEIAIAPAGAALDAFDWRISAAQVDAAGPFSRFAGVDRSLAVTQGGRMTLHRADGETISLAPGEPPARFPGEADIHATIAAPLSDFNVMTRRDAWAHEVETLALAAHTCHTLPLRRPGMQWLVYCVQGALSVVSQDREACRAQPGAAVWLDAPSGSETLIACEDSVGYLVALWPIA